MHEPGILMRRQRTGPADAPDGDPPGKRDPFKVSASAALDALEVRWHDRYGFGYDGTAWQAWRPDGTGELLSGSTPDELSAAILADLRAWSAA